MKAFDLYISKFDMNKELTKLKYNHSYRVMNTSRYLVKRLTSDKNKIELATIIGLIHDFGRFDQLKEFGTLSDNSMDHADYGVYLLFDKGYIKDYCGDQSKYNIIRNSISNHNKLNVDRTLYNDEELFFIDLIRDADKIDIINIYANLNEIEIKSDGKVSKEVKCSFENKSLSEYKNLKTNADDIVCKLSYIFDINYKESFIYLKKYKFLDNLFNRIENKEELKYFFDEIKKYIDLKIEEMK